MIRKSIIKRLTNDRIKMLPPHILRYVHETEQCYARRYQKRRTPTRTQATHANTDTRQDTANITHQLQDRLNAIEAQLQTPDDTSDGTQNFIIDSGANPTHTARPHASMRPSTGTLTTTATGHRAPITHTGKITITQKNNSFKIPAVHAPQIKKNLPSVHDLTAYGHVTFSRTKETPHRPTQLPPPQLPAQYQDGKYRHTHNATPKGARRYRRKTSNNKSRANPTKNSRPRQQQIPHHTASQRSNHHQHHAAPTTDSLHDPRDTIADQNAEGKHTLIVGISMDDFYQ